MYYIKTLCAAFVVPCLAMGQSITDSIHTVEEVTVTAIQYSHDIAPAQRLSGKQLQALSATNIADAARYFAGVQLKDYGGIGGLKTLDVRSMGSNHLGVFYDGIPIGNAQNGTVDLGRFSMDNIEELALYNGQRSQSLQAARDYASASAIYIRSRRPRFEQKVNTNIMATMRMGSFDLWNPSLLLERRFNARISGSLNAEYTYSSGKYVYRYKRVLPDGKTAWDTSAIRQNGDIRAMRTEAAVYGNAANTMWHIKAYYYDSQRGIPGPIVNNVYKRSERQWDRNFFVQGYAKVPSAMSASNEMLFNAKYSIDNLHYLAADTTQMRIDNTFRQYELYLSAADRYSITQWLDLSAAADYQWNTLQADLKLFAMPTRHTLLCAAAASLDYASLKAQVSILGTQVYDYAASTHTRRDNRRFTPSVIVSYQPMPSHDFVVRAFYKRIFRMPTFNDLYYTDIGNIYLRPEYAVQYNVGVEYSLGIRKSVRASININTYYNEVTDKIVAIPKGSGQYRWMMVNLGYVQIRGVDALARAVWWLPMGASFNVIMNYTYQRAQDFSTMANGSRSEWYGGQIAYIPRHSGSLIIEAAYSGWSIHYSFIYAGERYHNTANIRANYEQPYYTHDATLGKEHKFRYCSISASVAVNNILNQYYDVIVNYPMPGRHYKVTLKVKI